MQQAANQAVRWVRAMGSHPESRSVCGSCHDQKLLAAAQVDGERRERLVDHLLVDACLRMQIAGGEISTRRRGEVSAQGASIALSERRGRNGQYLVEPDGACLSLVAAPLFERAPLLVGIVVP